MIKNLQGATKTVVRGKFVALKMLVLEKKDLKIN